MFGRFVIITALLATPACTKKAPSTATPDAGGTNGKSGPRPSVARLPPPPEGPCAADADCKVYLEPCSCGCLAHIGEPQHVPDSEWSTMCGGGPPINCGAANPCMHVTASCDPTTKKCVLKR